MQRVYFVYEREKQHLLFERCRIEIQILNKEIPKASQQYIPLHEEERFEEELRETDPQTYYLYLLMKIYHFIEIMHGIRVTKMGADFTQDPFGTIWLMNISRVQYERINISPSIVDDEFQLADVFDRIKTESKGSLVLDNLTSQQFYSLMKQEARSILSTEMIDDHPPEKNKPNLGINSNNTELENPLLTQEHFQKSNDHKNGFKFYSPQTNFQFKFPSRPGTSQNNNKSGRLVLTKPISNRNRSPSKENQKQPEPGETIKIASLNIQPNVGLRPVSKLLFSRKDQAPPSRERPSVLRSTDFTVKGLNNTFTSRRGPSLERNELPSFTITTNRNISPTSRRTVGSRGFSCRKERQSL